MDVSFNLFYTAVSDKLPDGSLSIIKKMEAFRSLSPKQLDVLTERLKSMPNFSEIQQQNEQLQRVLIKLCQRKGLPVDEVMQQVSKRRFSQEMPSFLTEEQKIILASVLESYVKNPVYMQSQQLKQEIENQSYEVDLPSEVWGEIFSHMTNHELQSLKLLNRAASTEREKRYERGELTLKDYGCRNLKEAIQCIKAHNFSRASLQQLAGDNLLELIQECPLLKELSLSPEWDVLPEIGRLDHLETFSIEGVEVLTLVLPYEFLHLKNLRKLIYQVYQNAGKYGRPFHHDIRIFQMSKLKTLVLRTSDPLQPEIQNLTNLEHLDLKGSSIEALPNQIGNLENLKTLNLSHTAIKTLPDSLRELQNLTDLDLSHTAIRTLPNLMNLETLKVSVNPFFHQEELLDRMSHLREIVMFGISFSPEALKMRLSHRTSRAEAHLKRAIPELLEKVLHHTNASHFSNLRHMRDHFSHMTEPFIQKALMAIRMMESYLPELSEDLKRELLQVSDWTAQLEG